MLKNIGILIAVVVAFIAVVSFLQFLTSGPESISINQESDVGWQIVQSPVSGKCYEIFTSARTGGQIGHGFMGMDEISCEYLKLDQETQKEK